MARPPNEDRQPEILGATCRVIARVGVPGLSVRLVAEEASVSRALVGYYFSTRHDLLRAALAFAEQRAIDEISKRVDTDGTPTERITQALVLEFDGSAPVRDNWVIWSELAQAALFDESMRPALAHWSQEWNDAVARTIRDGQSDGSVSASVDPEATAERLTGLVDGLGDRWLLGEIAPERAQTLVRDAVHAELSR